MGGCCIVSAIFGIGPRLGILIWYLLRPEVWRGTFETWIWPLLGALFLPWTTLAYVWRARRNLDVFAVYDHSPGLQAQLSAKVLMTF